MTEKIRNDDTAAASRDHWEKVYAGRGENEVSWFEEKPAASLECFDWVGAKPDWAVVDVGGGASRLVDQLIEAGFSDLSVLDISPSALARAKARLGESAARVHWIAADATQWKPARAYDLWHDRAAFHFLTGSSEQEAYLRRLRQGLKPGGFVIIATFAADGPATCSGLPVARYDADRLGQRLGREFELVRSRAHRHATPWRSQQKFLLCVFRFVGSASP